MPAEPQITSIVKQLSGYWRDHPEASDTAHGILQWWLAPPAKPPQNLLQAALDWMLACGVVDALHAADGRIHFRRHHAKDGLDARIDAMARDPLSIPLSMPPPTGPRWPTRPS